MVQTGLLAAMTAVLSLIAVPMPSGVPLTLQVFAVALCGFLGGIRTGLPAVCIYLLLGAVGLPVFSGFRGGFGVLLDMTGGFLWGFLPLVILCGACAKTTGKITIRNVSISLFAALGGLLLCHLMGILQYMAVCGTAWEIAAAAVSLPFLGKDLLLVAAAWIIAGAVGRALQANGTDLG